MIILELYLCDYEKFKFVLIRQTAKFVKIKGSTVSLQNMFVLIQNIYKKYNIHIQQATFPLANKFYSPNFSQQGQILDLRLLILEDQNEFLLLFKETYEI